VEGVFIEHDCSLSDCEILKYFPSTRSVVLDRRNIESLKGIEFLQNLHSLIIGNKRNSGFDFSSLNGLKIEILDLSNFNKHDLSIFEYVKGADHLRFYGIDVKNLDFLKGFPVDKVGFFNGTFSALSSIDKLAAK
jgi:hypothetical protein